MKSRSKGLNRLVIALLLLLGLPILIKAITDFFLGYTLINIKSLAQLLPYSEFRVFNNEFLFKIAIGFSDFNFNFSTFLNLISLFDLLPFLVIVLLLELNRVSKKSKRFKWSLIIILAIYIFKYLGLFLIIGIVISLGYQFVLGFNYLGYWLLFIGGAFILSVIYISYTYNKSFKIGDY